MLTPQEIADLDALYGSQPDIQLILENFKNNNPQSAPEDAYEYLQTYLQGKVDVANDALQPAQQAVEDWGDANEALQSVAETKNFNMRKDSTTGSNMSQKTSNFNKSFNLKSAQIGTGMVPDGAGLQMGGGEGWEDPIGEDQHIDQQFPWNTSAELNAWLQGQVDFGAAYQEIAMFGSEDDERTKSLLQRYFDGRNEMKDEEQLQMAGAIFDTINPDKGGETLMVPEEQIGGDAFAASNDAIKKMAEEFGKKKRAEAQKTSFNLSKIAQHHSDQNTILWGPSQVRPDPFLRGQPVSDWHILERNKGFGQDVDGVWNIDWEAVWRGNVMDKYSRPYRDPKTGEWIGGYIHKRFEVDKNIPEENNMQLLPGERRKPRLPQYGSTESRLQYMRSQNDRGYGPETNTDAPFNWNTASSKKVEKKAAVAPPVKKTATVSPKIDKAARIKPATPKAKPEVKPVAKVSAQSAPVRTSQVVEARVVEPKRVIKQDNVHKQVVKHAAAVAMTKTGFDNRAEQLKEAQRYLANVLFDEWAKDPHSFDYGMLSGVKDRFTRRMLAYNMFKPAQVDVPTERQLGNAADEAATQRHQEDGTEEESGSGYENNFGTEIANTSKKKTDASTNSIGSALRKVVSNAAPTKVSQRPTGGDPFELPKLFPNEPDPRKPERVCPSCNSEVGEMNTTCPNCGVSLTDPSTGNFTKYGPDPLKPDTKPMGVRLAAALGDILFDAKTGKFFTKEAGGEGNQFDELKRRKKRVPELEEAPLERDWKSKEYLSSFKSLNGPERSTKKPNRDDEKRSKAIEVDKSCKDLAIDG